MSKFKMVVAVLLAAVASLVSGGAEGLGPVERSAALNLSRPGYVTESSTDPTANRCTVDPVGDVKTLNRDPGYIIAYRSGKSSCGNWAPTNSMGNLLHRQGIQRINRLGFNYFLVTGSVRNGAEPGFEVVRMGSRSNTYRALGSGGVTTASWPNCRDHVRVYSAFPDSKELDHAGGFQVNGSYAVVPLEDSGDKYTAGFRISDLRYPENPGWGEKKFRSRGPKTNAGAAALTRLNDGTYMVMVFGHDAREVEVFLSRGVGSMSMSSTFWQSKHQESTPFDLAYQNLQFVTSCSGELYLLGTHKVGPRDWADLWQVTLSQDYDPAFSKVANVSPRCRSSNTGGEFYCSFKAGAGAYVASNGRLFIYGVEHYDDAFPNTGYGVKVREFTN